MSRFSELSYSGAEIFLAPLPERDIGEALFPEERQNEIIAKRSPLARRESYFAWRLLEYAVMQTFGEELHAVGLEKKEGRWSARDFDISISHGGGALAVALSKSPVGIDLEPLEGDSDGEGVARRFFNDEELSLYLSSPEDARRESFLRIWTAKEAIFKAQSRTSFLPKATDSLSVRVHTEVARVADKYYVLSVAVDGEIKLHRDIALQ